MGIPGTAGILPWLGWRRWPWAFTSGVLYERLLCCPLALLPLFRALLTFWMAMGGREGPRGFLPVGGVPSRDGARGIAGAV